MYIKMIDYLLVVWRPVANIHAMFKTRTINTIGRSGLHQGHSGWWSGKFGLPQENEGILDKERNFALQQATYGHLKELLQEFVMCKERGTLFTPGIGFNVPSLTGRDCKLDTTRTAKRMPHFGKLLTADREKTKWPYFYSVNRFMIKF